MEGQAGLQSKLTMWEWPIRKMRRASYSGMSALQTGAGSTRGKGVSRLVSLPRLGQLASWSKRRAGWDAPPAAAAVWLRVAWAHKAASHGAGLDRVDQTHSTAAYLMNGASRMRSSPTRTPMSSSTSTSSLISTTPRMACMCRGPHIWFIAVCRLVVLLWCPATE